MIDGKPEAVGHHPDHQFWIPVRVDLSKSRPWQGPLLDVFARLKAVGSLIAVAAFSAVGIGLGQGTVLLVTVAAVITIVAAFAALGPARRSLRLPTVDALRVDG